MSWKKLKLQHSVMRGLSRMFLRLTVSRLDPVGSASTFVSWNGDGTLCVCKRCRLASRGSDPSSVGAVYAR